LNDVLPDGGFPQGVVELTSPGALGGATSMALAAIRSGQARGHKAWCAWIDPEATLHAPGLVAAGVDLNRMLVVRPARAQLGPIAVRVVGSGAFEVVVVDFDAIAGADRPAEPQPRKTREKKAWAPEVLVRKLALSAESSEAMVLLLTDRLRARGTAWPVSLRLELGRPSRGELSVKVAKDRRGRVGAAKTIAFQPIARAVG